MDKSPPCEGIFVVYKPFGTVLTVSLRTGVEIIP